MLKQKLWIILPGGGVKGVFQYGFIEGLMEKYKDTYDIDRVYGTSVGSIISPLVASQSFDLLKEIFNNIKTIDDILESWGCMESVLKFVNVFKKLGAYKSVKLVDIVLNKLNANKTKDEVNEIYKKLHVVAWDFMNKKEVWFNGDNIPIGIRASSALSLAVPPIAYEDSYLTDGGITDVIPLTKALTDYMLENEIDKKNITIMIVDCDTRIPVKLTVKPTNPILYAMELFNDASANLTANEYSLAEFKHPDIKICYIKPSTNTFDTALDIDQIKMKKVYTDGYEYGKTYLIKIN